MWRWLSGVDHGTHSAGTHSLLMLSLNEFIERREIAEAVIGAVDGGDNHLEAVYCQTINADEKRHERTAEEGE